MSSYFCVFWESKFVLILFNCFQFCLLYVAWKYIGLAQPHCSPCLNWDFIGDCMNVRIGYRILVILEDIRINFSAIYFGIFTFEGW